MANMFTVESLANRWVNSSAQSLPEVGRKKAIFNFKVMGFDIASITMIALAILAICTGSLLAWALTLAAWSTRTAFFKAVVLTGSEMDAAFLDINSRLNGIGLQDTRNGIASYLEIRDPNWDFMHSQILDFPIWMNQAPMQAQQAAVIEQAEPIAEPASVAGVNSAQLQALAEGQPVAAAS